MTYNQEMRQTLPYRVRQGNSPSLSFSSLIITTSARNLTSTQLLVHQKSWELPLPMITTSMMAFRTSRRLSKSHRTSTWTGSNTSWQWLTRTRKSWIRLPIILESIQTTRRELSPQPHKPFSRPELTPNKGLITIISKVIIGTPIQILIKMRTEIHRVKMQWDHTRKFQQRRIPLLNWNATKVTANITITAGNTKMLKESHNYSFKSNSNRIISLLSNR